MTAVKTQMTYGDPKSKIQQAVGVFAMSMQRNTQMNHLTGSFPKLEGAIVGRAVYDGRLDAATALALIAASRKKSHA